MSCTYCGGDHSLTNCPWRRHMRLLALIPVVLLAGCASPKWLENRLSCTVDGKEAHVVSKWGPVSIGSKLADADARVVCQAQSVR